MDSFGKTQDTQVLSETVSTRIGFSYRGESYSGAYSEGESHFVCSSPSGKQLFVYIEPVAEDMPEGQPAVTADPERYPHLRLPVVRFNNDRTKMFRCYEMGQSQTGFSLEKVMFGAAFSLQERIHLSLSLAAAFAELEEVFDRIPVRQLNLDAFEVEKETGSVRIDCDKLKALPVATADEIPEAYRKMAVYGLMPPEWYEDHTQDPATLQGLRHILAVCLFRILCASDPFDGTATLQRFPYRGREALRGIYGAESIQFILGAESENQAGFCIGGRARTVFAQICPSLKRPFASALMRGVRNPEERPAAAVWLENQKRMLSWFSLADKEWRVADLMTGAGTFPQLSYLVLENGTILPLFQNKPVYRFMLEPADSPTDDEKIGTVDLSNGRAELVLSAEAGGRLPLKKTGKTEFPGGICGQITDAPWKDNVKG